MHYFVPFITVIHEQNGYKIEPKAYYFLHNADGISAVIRCCINTTIRTLERR